MAFPNLSPYEFPSLLCPQCGTTMRPAVEKMANGRLAKVIMYCDSEDCKYAFEPTLQHSMGTNSPKYVPPGQAVPPQRPGPPSPQPKTELTKIGEGRQ